ncbi:MAG: UDP-N-acetylmuramoyl-L-alanine--D-glutamate ligase, partial [Anaerolineae bacterium]
MTNSQGKTVLVIGAARQGLALSRFLAARGARVVLNDRRPADELAAARATLGDVPVEWATGGHPLALLDG